MNNEFVQRVKAAAVAGWWTLLIAFVFLLLAWVIFRTLLATRPEWLLTLCGPDVSWANINTMGLWLLTVFKLCIYLLALVVVWLSLWASQLRKLPRG